MLVLALGAMCSVAGGRGVYMAGPEGDVCLLCKHQDACSWIGKTGLLIRRDTRGGMAARREARWVGLGGGAGEAHEGDAQAVGGQYEVRCDWSAGGEQGAR